MTETKVKGYAEYICPLTGGTVTIPFASLYKMVNGEIPLKEFNEQALMEMMAGFASFLLEQDEDAKTYGSLII